VNDYVDDVYTVDVHNLMHMSEEEQQKHITQIAKNIIAQNKIDTIERNVESKLELEKIKFFHSYSYDNNELVCNCYLKVDKNAKHKNYKDFKIFVTYYDENYNEIYSDSYELDQVYRGYGKEIQIISFPETKIKPFKSSVFVDYSYAY